LAEVIGLSRGGCTSKVHAAVNAGGRPLGPGMPGVQLHDSREISHKIAGDGALVAIPAKSYAH